MKQKLLLLETDKYLRYHVARGLRRRGFKVKTVADTIAAQVYLNVNEFDGLIVGLGNPEALGVEIAWVSSLPLSSRPPLVTLGLDPNHPAAGPLRPQAMLDIPFDLNQLRDAVHKVTRGQ